MPDFATETHRSTPPAPPERVSRPEPNRSEPASTLPAFLQNLSPQPQATPRPQEPLPSGNDLVRKHLWELAQGHFDSFTQELFTNYLMRSMDPDFILDTFDSIDSSIEDNVAAAFTQKLVQLSLLDTVASQFRGRTLLTKLYDAMMTGSVSDFERQMGTEILHAKMRQLTPEQYLQQQQRNARGRPTQIFPIRFMRVTPFQDDAPLEAHLTDEGRVWVKYPARIQDTPAFAADFRTLEYGTFLSQGQELNPNEIVGIRDYEEHGKLSYLPALALIDYANKSDRSTAGKIVEVSIAAATFGLSGPAIAGEEASVWAIRLARLDKIATFIHFGAFFVGENRDWIIDKLGPAGERIVQVFEIADTVVAVYGVARLGQSGVQLAKRLRSASKSASIASLYADLEASEREGVNQLVGQTDDLASNLESAAAELPPPGPTEVGPNAQPAHTPTSDDFGNADPRFKSRFEARQNPPVDREAAQAVGARTGTDDRYVDLYGQQSGASVPAENPNATQMARQPRPRQNDVNPSGARPVNDPAGEGVIDNYTSGGAKNRGASYVMSGQEALRNESRFSGFHVYEYRSADGSLLYVGKSGGGQSLKADWIKRLRSSHINTSWIAEAETVTITYGLTAEEMDALESALIPEARANLRGGDYDANFAGGELGVNAVSAAKKGKQVMLAIDAIPVR